MESVQDRAHDRASGGAGAAVAEARLAQRGWAELPVSQRLRIVRRFRRRLAGELEAVLQTLRRPGRADHESLVAEVIPLADACRFLEREAAGLLRARKPSLLARPSWLAGVSAEVRREPFDVVLVIAPANDPLLLAGVQVLQAVVAGTGVVVKPAPGFSAPMALMVD